MERGQAASQAPTSTLTDFCCLYDRQKAAALAPLNSPAGSGTPAKIQVSGLSSCQTPR